MKYYEDITQMRGDETDAVDVIIGGSPCQGFSDAGARAGLDDERSVLFLDQIRIMKEMHSKYGRNKPRYMVWENVPRALSSAGGEDFRRVLEETAKAADETAVVPGPPKGKWASAGCIMADGWSVAWRILDAQFWGVPQRRRRIALIADFGGQSAPEILFERESVPGYTAESGEARQGAAGSAESGFGAAICIQGNCIDRPAVYDARGNGEIAPTITGDHWNRITDYTAVCCEVFREGSFGGFIEDGFGTLKARGGCLGGGSESFAVSQSTVRRLTPLECERLQGYPDGWTDIGEWTDSKGKTHKTSDSARYKALGNSIALPPWRYVCRKLSAMYGTQPTMGSLFDGIGGFPLIWREINGDNSAPWACEIDEFCRAVTQRRLP